MGTFHMITGALFRKRRFGSLDAVEAVRHAVVNPTLVKTLGDSQAARHYAIMLNPGHIGSIRAARHQINMTNPDSFVINEISDSLIVQEEFGQLDYTTANVKGTDDTSVTFTRVVNEFNDLEYSINFGSWESTGITSLPATFVVEDSKYQNISFRLKKGNLYSKGDKGKATPQMLTRIAVGVGGLNFGVTSPTINPVAGKTYLINMMASQWSNGQANFDMNVGAPGRANNAGDVLTDLTLGNLLSISGGVKGGLFVWKAPTNDPVTFRVNWSNIIYNCNISIFEINDDRIVPGMGASTKYIAGDTKLETVFGQQQSGSMVFSSVLKNSYAPIDPMICNMGFQKSYVVTGDRQFSHYVKNDPIGGVFKNTITDPTIPVGSVLLSLELKKE